MKNTRKGFTLVELVIVIAVIAILAAVLIPTFGGIIEKANESAAQQEARNAYSAYLSEYDYVTNAEEPKDEGWVEVKGGYYVRIENGVAVQSHVKADCEVANCKEAKHLAYRVKFADAEKPTAATGLLKGIE